MAVDASGMRRALTERVAAIGPEWVRQVADDVAQDAPRRSGELQASVRPGRRRQFGVSRYRGEIVATVIQAATTEKGARPHTIRPRRPRGVLRFQVGGRTVFARVVHHPGNPPRPWFAPGLGKWGPGALQRADRRTR